MVSVGHSAFLALLFSSALGVANTIGSLRDGPMVGRDGREYKTAKLGVDAATKNACGPSSICASPIRVQCTEAKMIIVIKADLYNNGRLVSPGELCLGQAVYLGESPCRAFAISDTEYVIEAELHDCGSKLTISGDSVVYSNELVFSPADRNHAITRTRSAVVPLSCHYKRTHFVSSSVQKPAVAPSTSTKYSAELSGFSLKLKADDLRSEQLSDVFYLGDLLHLEASYSGPGPVPRRLFIDNCVATLQPDPTSVPRYYFVKNHGCLTDSKEEGSNSLFRAQTSIGVVRLQIDAFLFFKDSSNSVFITCQLKAIAQMWRSSPVSKACNYINSRWTNVDGNDDVCTCCEHICYESSPKWNSETNQRHQTPEDAVVLAIVTIGPMMISPRK